MIDSIALKFGSSSGQPPLEFPVTPVTVFVGPNNSGKSKIISEIHLECTVGGKTRQTRILENIHFSTNDESDVDRIIQNITLTPLRSEALYDGHIYVGRKGERNLVYLSSLRSAITDPNDADYRPHFSQHYLKYDTLLLDGTGRIGLVNEQNAGDLLAPALTSLQHLFRDDGLRASLSEIVYRALGSYPVIDPTKLGSLRLRLSKVAPPSPAIERGLSEESVRFHSEAVPIADASDGAKAFTGILSEILAGNPRILLMDEPEAFLHPSLAFMLGREVARSLAATDKRLFVSTHSSQFLMGCIQSGVPINVVRLTYQDGVPTARLLDSETIVSLMRNPLLRSTGVISALFYQSVVVTEGDPDRAFYQEINERLTSRDRGVNNCIFLNAQNKQTIPIIVSPLRKLGIPAAAIYDIDYVKDGGGVATRFLEAAGIPALTQSGLSTTRAAILRALQEAHPEYKTKGGIAVLPEGDRNAANEFFDQLDQYGAFVVRGGELESWLSELQQRGHGSNWLIPIFERLGEDPESDSYVHPGENDIWEFMDRVARWLADPRRKGIPL
ncbi:ATP-dependent nuclease [Aureimonas sp. D3]|uniref:ATP-dependent nuclease n=1 Tax=Aureimonas sp. D3 TaxID=1638164 RepID=UPI0009E6EC64|nr:AAA family ATPase [Aureimonas sp. D3]